MAVSEAGVVVLAGVAVLAASVAEALVVAGRVETGSHVVIVNNSCHLHRDKSILWGMDA